MAEHAVSVVKIVVRSNGNSKLQVRPPKGKLRKRSKPEKHHLHSAVPALLAPTSEAVDHVVTGSRLRQLKEPFNVGDRVQLRRRWEVRTITCDERDASLLAPQKGRGSIAARWASRASCQQSDSPRQVTQFSGKGFVCKTVKASRVGLLDLSQSCGTCGRGAAPEGRLVHLLSHLGLVAAKRLGWDHVVTGRRVHQLKQSCISCLKLSSPASTQGALQRGRSRPFAPAMEVSPFRRNPASQFKLAHSVPSCSC